MPRNKTPLKLTRKVTPKENTHVFSNNATLRESLNIVGSYRDEKIVPDEQAQEIKEVPTLYDLIFIETTLKIKLFTVHIY